MVGSSLSDRSRLLSYTLLIGSWSGRLRIRFSLLRLVGSGGDAELRRRGASRTVAGDAGGGLFESGLGRSPHLGAWLDECCCGRSLRKLGYAPPAGAVRVWCFRPCAGTLAPGLREAPDYAPGRLGGWVTSCGWRRPSRPRGEALQIQYRAGSARALPSRVGGVCSRHSVNLSLAACASRALRFESKNNS